MANRLANESSPYLLQHAQNPVDWYPWNEEALTRARAEDLPILVSIGYSSCHWCHVMEHESFSDDATAQFMNEHFVCVKVDREERPDVDAVYMAAVQAMTGHGGWPLTGFLTPAQVPFHMGTYFPPEPRSGMPSFRQVMEAVLEAWHTRRAEIEDGAERVIDVLSATGRLQPDDDPLTVETLSAARTALAGSIDHRFGGFGGAPKFPIPLALDFMLGSGHDEDRNAALTTLSAMAAGGIYDQLSGGFSRYSVDERWHVPHFEKMLYDNAQLARTYLHGFQISRDTDLERVCRETLDWMLDEMHAPEGGLCSALDADSEGPDGLTEGYFYSWDIAEFRAACGDAADDMCRYFGVIDHGELDGRNVLHVAVPERRPDEPVFAAARAALLAERAKRPRPFRDEKRITAWNALAVAALADAGRVLREPRYLSAAVAVAEFVEARLRDLDGRLRRSWLGGKPGPEGFLEDHAFVCDAWLTLYEATFDARWFELAQLTADKLIEHFADPAGGFFTTAAGGPQLIARQKDLEDNPTPSGNSAAAHALLRLAALTGESEYERLAAQTLRILRPMAEKFPTSFGKALQAIAFYALPVHEIALVGPELGDFVATVDERYRPRAVVAGADDPATVSGPPLLLDRPLVDGLPTAYVCERFACRRPVTDAGELRELLGGSLS